MAPRLPAAPTTFPSWETAEARRRRLSQPGNVAAIGIHRVNLEVAVDLTMKSDPITSGRPGWLRVQPGEGRQAHWFAAVSIHDVDLGVAVAVASKAMRSAFGDQSGFVSAAAFVVSRMGAAPSAFIT